MNPTTPNKSEGAEWRKQIRAQAKEYGDARMFVSADSGAELDKLCDLVAHQRQQAVAEFARGVRRKIRDKTTDSRFIHSLDLEVMLDEALEQRGISLN